MDRSPSMKSLTEEPPKGAPCSLLGSDDEYNSVSIHSPLGFGVRLNHASSLLCNFPAATQRCTVPNITPSSSREIAQSSSSSSRRQPLVVAAAAGALEQQYCRTLQQLERVKQMYRCLDTHNDELENAFMVLRTRLDAFRSCLVFRLLRTAKEVRGEVQFLRDTTSHLLKDFAGCMLHCRKLIMASLYTGIPPPLVDGCHNPMMHHYTSPSGMGVRSPETSRVQHRHESRYSKEVSPTKHVGETPVRSPHQPSCHSSAAFVNDSRRMEEVLHHCSVLEQKLREERASHERHLRSMKEMHDQKEKTLKRRVRLLERLLGQDACSLCPSDNYNDDGQDGADEGFRQAPVMQRGDALVNDSHCVGASMSTCSALGRETHRDPPSVERRVVDDTKDAPDDGIIFDRDDNARRWRGTPTDDILSTHEPGSTEYDGGAVSEEGLCQSHRNPQSRRREHERDLLLPLGLRNDDSAVSPKLQCDLDRRVQLQLAQGQAATSSRSNAFHQRLDLATGREKERWTEEIAGRLFDDVGDASAMQLQHQHTRSNWWHGEEKERRRHAYAKRGLVGAAGVVDRLYYLPRSPQKRPHTNTYIASVPRSGMALRPDGPSDLSVVARGLWAEKLLLQKRVGRRHQRPGTN